MVKNVLTELCSSRVPLGTSLSTMLSWRATFLLVGIWGIVILYVGGEKLLPIAVFLKCYAKIAKFSERCV